MDDHEFEGAAIAAPDRMATLERELEEAIKLEEYVAQLEDDLKAAKRSLNAIKSNRIPDLMAEMQMDSVRFRGWSVTVADFVSGTLPKEGAQHDAAINWLEEHDGAGLIKTDLSVGFGRSQHDEALSLAAELEGNGYAPLVKTGVHPQTLQAYARERMRNGDPIDLDVLGLYAGKVAKLKRGDQ